MPTIEARVLGPMQVRVRGVPIPLGGTKQRSVLGLLLLSPNEVVSVDRLVDAIWGDTASQGSPHTLQVYISKLRSALNPDRGEDLQIIESAAPGYLARVNADSLDLLRFEGLLHEARSLAGTGDAGKAVELYRTALSLWSGPVLADLGDQDFVRLEAHRLEIARLTANADCIDAELALGRHGQVLSEIVRLAAANPMDERLHGQLMIALYRAGRHVDALEAYERVRRVLADELGLEPSGELKRLEEKILLHDPELMMGSIRPPGATVTLEQGTPDLQPAWLEGIDKRFDLQRAVTTIGRLPDRAIQVDETTVSRRHAEIRRVGSRFALVDVGSTNGVAVNGRTVTERDLEDGDVIMIGPLEFVFRVCSS